MNSSVAQKTEKKTFIQKFLDFVEIGGNKLPHPVTLFAMLCVAIAIISAIAASMGLSVEADILNRTTNEIETTVVSAVSLLNGEGFSYMLENAVSNFTSFAPLGVVLVGMLGIGIAESSGYIGTLLKKVVSITPSKLIVPMVVFLGIMSNVASDAGYVILIPLGALVFMAYGRHPLAGIAAAFAGVSGGFSANLLIGTIDPMLAGITNEAAHILDPTVNITPTANYLFMVVSTFLITILGTILTTKVIEPRLGKYEGSVDKGSDLQNISDKEKKAMTAANITLIAMVVGLIVLIVMPNSFLRNLEADGFLNSIIDHSTFMNGLIPIVALLFFVPSVVYGKIAGTVKNEKEVAAHMSKAMSSMGGYLCLAFVASQFISYFNYTNLGTIIAIIGAELLQSANIGAIPLLVGFIIITAFINLFMGSASAKWAIMAPVFIPMFIKLNIDPAAVQTAYRIADSSTNIISPLMSYFAMVIVFTQVYDKKSGIGTITSMMLPYSMTFLVAWTVMFIIWMVAGIPFGF
ncbi:MULTISPECIES: AbgT family transporter [Romboutsia]|uniref:p-aminobenzoyl-glutamate transport protein n=2 Tax=Romboutsia ilealis TaxID=1115758 RepID=A0A1V1I1V3_9FIRM|nr:MULTISPECIES: AbgT family transporter [Romboutsia]MCI9259203.1 AbgT family transporter [Romboutsia sp.]CED94211.1 p-aminobenzoyl-glutamate transport protein [Romboutsia ilealis]